MADRETCFIREASGNRRCLAPLPRRFAVATRWLWLLGLWPGTLDAAPVLRSASADVTFASPTSCEVTLAVVVDGALEVQHRVELISGGRVDLLDVRDATAGPPQTIGRTLALHVASVDGRYTVQYRAALAPDRPFRCPLWLPAAPADGRSRDVELRVAVPVDTFPSASMPALTWRGSRGEATLGHLPAFVLVPFHGAGESAPWDVARVMDAVALASLVAGSLWWLRRARQRPAGGTAAGEHARG